MDKSVGNSNFGREIFRFFYRRIFSLVNPSVIQIWAGNFPLLLSTEKFVDKFVGKINLNYRQIFLSVNKICVIDEFFRR